MEIVWQASTAPGRKRTLQDKFPDIHYPSIRELTTCDSPCHSCRTRKKRCYHAAESPVHVTKSPHPVSAASTTRSPPAISDSSPSPGRVSPYNPESVLEDLSGDPTPVPVPAPKRLRLCPGDLPITRDVNSTPPDTTVGSDRVKRQLFWYRRQRWRVVSPISSENHRRYLEDVGALLTLPKTTTDALLPIYVTLMDDLIPLMDGPSVVRDYSNGKASNYLVRAMCLVTCKSRQAAPFLRLTDHGSVLEPLEFAANLLAGLDAAIKANLERDRVTKIQILALMHLHNDGLCGVDRSSSYLSQAICEAWSISLHLKVPGNPDQEQCDVLWWALRNFDRLNKPIMGAAPFMIDDTDIAIDRTKPKDNSYRSRVMTVSLTLGDLMTTATRVYKASSTSTVDDSGDFPSLSELTVGVCYGEFHRSHSAYLETWYHVAAMLSCRYSGPGSTQYDRRLQSADRILNILSQDDSESLPPLPLVPYAISMATTVIYRALRDGMRETGAACKDLGLCCDVLETLSRRWTSTKGVAKLARRLWRYTKNGVLHGHLGTGKHTLESRAASTGTRSFDSSPRGFDPSANSQPSVVSTPVSAENNESIGQGQAAGVSLNPEIQLVDSWEQANASYLQLDRAFYDLFDSGMPDVFQDPESWNFLNMGQGGDDSLLPPPK